MKFHGLLTSQKTNFKWHLNGSEQPSVVVYLDATQKSLEKSRLFAFFTPIF